MSKFEMIISAREERCDEVEICDTCTKMLCHVVCCRSDGRGGQRCISSLKLTNIRGTQKQSKLFSTLVRTGLGIAKVCGSVSVWN